MVTLPTFNHFGYEYIFQPTGEHSLINVTEIQHVFRGERVREWLEEGDGYGFLEDFLFYKGYASTSEVPENFEDPEPGTDVSETVEDFCRDYSSLISLEVVEHEGHSYEVIHLPPEIAIQYAMSILPMLGFVAMESWRLWNEEKSAREFFANNPEFRQRVLEEHYLSPSALLSHFPKFQQN